MCVDWLLKTHDVALHFGDHGNERPFVGHNPAIPFGRMMVLSKWRLCLCELLTSEHTFMPYP